MTGRRSERVDLLVIGSGPAGAAFARRALDTYPAASVLVIEAGPRLTAAPGENVRNVPAERRKELQERVSGPQPAGFRPFGARPLHARPGTVLIKDDDGTGDGQDGMPAAAYSANVGGMGAHWTCAVPRPGGTERVPFIDDAEMDAALDVAEDLLNATTTGFRPTAASTTVREKLARRYDHLLPQGRRTGPMPLACAPSADGGLPRWTGTDTILGETGDRLVLRADTVARRLLLDGDLATGAEVVDTRTGEVSQIRAGAVAVACDALRTPQLLWASGVRPDALGRYLNDQPQVVVGARVDLPAETARGATATDPRDTLTGVSWVPFADGVHPFHGQVMQLDASPIAVHVGDRPDPRPMVGLGWFLPKDLQADDRVWFDDDDVDAYGLPRVHIDYRLTAGDRDLVSRAVKELEGLAAELGEQTRVPDLLPAGSSLHYQGSVRMGPADDGTSVCDERGRVWGFRNLFVGGNGVIPTATACNPTLTAVALVVRSVEAMAGLLDTRG
ncbi:GMC oxidoreductase [Actinomadura macrotermitis]|uniref:Oxygen-dependent choline dehydrogenase n=1 Tax=Actinomadura macrotermitis TaxID=2585200 RepID=A0A7K0BLN5_9ACTN|nr:GMC oxidoreductase [Actinomadura macrotermitis]MQY02093.1 Oxygen-dependent choline dehydrogenase [Actinomadura macrotermitis]